MANEAAKTRPWLAAVIAFGVVAGGIYVAGILVTTLLRHVILPLFAIVAGFVAAKAVHRAAK